MNYTYVVPKDKWITSFEDLCKLKGFDPKTIMPDFSMLPEHLRDHMINYTKLIMCIEGLNEQALGKRWKPDYFTQERKYYPWPWVKADEERPSGFGFADTDYDCTHAGADVGSRQQFPTVELEQHAWEHFQEYYLPEKLIIE